MQSLKKFRSSKDLTAGLDWNIPLLQGGCMSSDNSLDLSLPQLPHLLNQVVIVPIA